LPFGFLGALGFAGASVWLQAMRPCLLASAVLLLVIGFVQIYAKRNQCRKRSLLSIADPAKVNKVYALEPNPFEAARIVSAVEICSDPKSGLGLGSTGIVKDLLVRIQRFARPVA
jgi:hypothetical protein